MPNHITNIIKIENAGGTDMKEIRAAFLNENNHVDFNVITPSPKCLEGFEPHHGIITTAKAMVQADVSGNRLVAGLEFSNREEALEKKDELSEADALAVDRAIKNYKECGYVYWFDWQNANWGTKWNAYSQPDEGYPDSETVFRFDTAWSHPVTLIEKLSARLPDVTFSIKFADEDTGSNCGTYTIKNSEAMNENIAPRWDEMTDDQKKEFTKLAFEIRYENEDPRSHGYDENWQYSDDVYEQYELENEN